jgi:hypothetical protein
MAQRWAVAVLSLSGVAVLAGCGSSGTTSSGSSASSSAPAPATSASATKASAGASGSSSAIPCAQITALRSTLTDLSHTSVSPTSAPRIAVDLGKAEQELGALKSQGTSAFSAQANQLTSALDVIKTDAAALAKNPSSANLTKLTGAVNSFKTTAQPLIKEMQAACPSS